MDLTKRNEVRRTTATLFHRDTATGMLTFNGVLVATFRTWAEGYERERENLI
jgi:hypothetical protein